MRRKMACATLTAMAAVSLGSIPSAHGGAPFSRESVDAAVARIELESGTGPRLGPRNRTIAAVILASAAADLASTELAIHGGAHEGNPAMGSHLAQRVAVKAAMSGVAWLTVRHLRNHGHDRAAKLGLVLHATMSAGLTANNLALASK